MTIKPWAWWTLGAIGVIGVGAGIAWNLPKASGPESAPEAVTTPEPVPPPQEPLDEPPKQSDEPATRPEDARKRRVIRIPGERQRRAFVHRAIKELERRMPPGTGEIFFAEHELLPDGPWSIRGRPVFALSEEQLAAIDPPGGDWIWHVETTEDDSEFTVTFWLYPPFRDGMTVGRSVGPFRYQFLGEMKADGSK